MVLIIYKQKKILKRKNLFNLCNQNIKNRKMNAIKKMIIKLMIKMKIASILTKAKI